jgi:general secretion pathway protein G
MKKGFTLIELLVVISIIGILATLVAANLNSARSRARDAQRKSDLKNIETAFRLYYNDKGTYPPENSLTWGDEFSDSGTIYMQKLPQDSLAPDQTYSYKLDSGGDSFTLSACLENASDASAQNITIAGWTCTSQAVFQLKQ